MQSKPITTKVMNLNPAHGEVYSIQHYVIKFEDFKIFLNDWFFYCTSCVSNLIHRINITINSQINKYPMNNIRLHRVHSGFIS